MGNRAAGPISPRLGGLESNEISNPGNLGLPTDLFPSTLLNRLAFWRRMESIVLLVLLVQQPGAPSPTWTRDSVSSYSSGHPPLLFPRNRVSRIQNIGYAQPAAPRSF
jgi:hypothetical protein